MGIGAEAFLRALQAHQAQQFQSAGARLRPAHAAVQHQGLADLPVDGVQRIERGHRLLEDDADAVAAHLAQGRLVGADQLAPVQAHAAARVPRLRIRQELQDRERGDRLARAALADQRERLALVDVERHPPHRLERAALDLEVDRQILHFEQAHGAPTQRKVLRGSKASRTASPMKISSDSITAITSRPLMPSQGAWRLFLPWASRSPSEGDPGGRPKPRKSSEVRATMEPIRMNGMNVMVATMALGRM